MKNITKKILQIFTKSKKDYRKIKNKLVKMIDTTGLKDIDTFININVENGYSNLALNRIAFNLLKDTYMSESVIYGEKVVKEENDPRFMRVLATRYKWLGNNKRYKELQKDIKKIENSDELRVTLDNLEKIYNENGIDACEAFIYSSLEKNSTYQNTLYKKFFSIAKDKDTSKALEYAEKIVTEYTEVKFLEVVIKRYKKVGHYAKAKALENIVGKTKITLAWFKSELISIAQHEREDDAIFFIQQCSYAFKNNIEFEKQVFILMKDIYPAIALEYGLKYYEQKPKDYKFTSVLALRLVRNEKLEKALALYVFLYENNIDNRLAYENKIITCIGTLHKIRIQELVESTKTEDIVNYLLPFLPKDMRKESNIIYKIIFDTIRHESLHSEKAIDFAEKYLEIIKDSFTALALSNLLFREGHINRALQVKHLDKEDAKTKIKLDHYQAYRKLLEEGFDLPAVKTNDGINKINIGYCLHNTLPYNSGGYATRSHGLAKGVQLSGFEIQVISRLGYPNDLSSYRDEESVLPEIEMIDGINYHRLFTDLNQYGVATLDVYLKEYGEALYELAKELNITILHGASNFMNGIAANYAARKLGIKSVYEVRGLWEITRMSRQPEWEGSEHFNMIRRLETEAALNADAVLTITQALKDEMVSRGVPASKITVVSNGVHVDRFVPKERVVTLEEKLGYKDKIVIGFIGSVVSYEGLEYLVEAAKLLKEWNVENFAVMIVGDGAVWEDIKNLTKELEVEEYFTFTGRVPHEEVEDYYSLVDIAPFPRKGLPVCEMVSPLKPFEAMSMAKAVLSSDVAALAEIVDDGKTGLLFKKDDSEDFAKVILKLIQDKELRSTLGHNARKWVEEEKDWKMLSKRISGVYKDFLNA